MLEFKTITNRALVYPLLAHVKNVQSNFQWNIIGYCHTDLVTSSRCLLSRLQLHPPFIKIDEIIVSPASLGSLILDSII